MNKFDAVRKIVSESNPMYRSVLDVGCRDCALKPYLSDFIKIYRGVDLFQNKTNSVDFVCDFEKGVEVSNCSYDLVTALDLVEHLNDFSGGMKELLRITKKDLVVVLPNISHLSFRLRFLFSGRLGYKYDLSYGMGLDRHRWVTVLPQLDKFMKDFSLDNKVWLEKKYIIEGNKNKVFEFFAKLINLPPPLYVFSVMYILRK